MFNQTAELLLTNTDTVSTWFNTSNQTPKKKSEPTLFPPVYSNFTAGYALKVINHRYNIKKWTWDAYIRDAVKEQMKHLQSFDTDAFIVEGLTTSYVRRLAELYSL